jgi:hypothetical protein
VIGERVRDKIAASKRKGIWVGGTVPLGYESINKKLFVEPEEAETVRLIFRRYLELGSVRALIEDLDRSGIRTRRQTLSNGTIRGSVSARWRTFCKTGSISARWSIVAPSTSASRSPLWIASCSRPWKQDLPRAPPAGGCGPEARRQSLLAGFSTTAVTA